MEIQQLAAPGISLCMALKDGAATAGTSSPGGTSQQYGAGSVPVLSAYIAGMLGRRPALSGGTQRAMLCNKCIQASPNIVLSSVCCILPISYLFCTYLPLVTVL